jgi:hypothetical protein
VLSGTQKCQKLLSLAIFFFSEAETSRCPYSALLDVSCHRSVTVLHSAMVCHICLICRLDLGRAVGKSFLNQIVAQTVKKRLRIESKQRLVNSPRPFIFFLRFYFPPRCLASTPWWGHCHSGSLVRIKGRLPILSVQKVILSLKAKKRLRIESKQRLVNSQGSLAPAMQTANAHTHSNSAVHEQNLNFGNVVT